MKKSMLDEIHWGPIWKKKNEGENENEKEVLTEKEIDNEIERLINKD